MKIGREEKRTSALNGKAANEEYVVPDLKISIADMHRYGYRYEEMLPISQDRALELFDKAEIFALYPDDTEAAIENAEEIKNHCGIFGIEKAEWKKVLI